MKLPMPPPAPFEIESAPSLIRNVCFEEYGNSKAPMESIFAAAITAISTVCQCLFDVDRGGGKKGPVSTNFLTIADSGERKSTVVMKFHKAIHTFERKNAQNRADTLSNYQNRLSTWKASEKACLKALEKSAAESGNFEPEGFLVSALELIRSHKPQLEKSIRLVYSNVTPAALAKGIGEFPYVAILSDEALDVFSGGVLSELGLLNSSWGGSPVNRDRVSAVSVKAPEVRLTMGLSVQGLIWDAHHSKQAQAIRSSGFLSRTFVSRPASTIGRRTISNTLENGEHLKAFTDRLSELIEKVETNLDTLAENRTTLTFDKEAECEWLDVYNHIETQSNFGGVFYEVRDQASKMAEMIARLAALFHIFEGLPGTEINKVTMNQACRFGIWYLHEFARTCVVREISPEEQDVLDLAEYFRTHLRKGRSVVEQNKIVMGMAPKRLRAKSNHAAAVAELVQRGEVRFFHQHLMGRNGIPAMVPTLMIDLQFYARPISISQNV